MLISYHRGQTGIVLRVKIRNSSVSTGAGLTGLTYASSGLRIGTIADNEATSTAYTVAGSTIETITTLGTYQTPTATKCRFKEVDATSHPGIYEVQLANARYAVASAKSLIVSISGATNAAECDVTIPLTDVDPYDAAAFGLTRLDAAMTSRPTLAEILAGGDVDGFTVEQSLKLLLALAGKLSGAGTGTEVFRAVDDSKARITATVDASGNRTAITYDATG